MLWFDIKMRLYITLMFAFCHGLNAKSSTAGRDFYFGIFVLVDSCCLEERNIVTIDVTNVSPRDAQVRLNIPYFHNDTYTFYNIPAGQGQSIQIKYTIEREGTFKDGRGIYINSDNDVVVIVTNAYNVFNMMDVYNILPVTSIGTRYNILSYGSGTSWSWSTRGSGFLVTAVYDNTNLTVQINNTYEFTILLDALDVYQYVCSNFCDLSGTLLISDQIISVIAGATYTEALGKYDYIASEMIPTSFLSTSYIVPPLFPRSGFNIKVISEYGSVVNVSNTTHAFSYSSPMRDMYFESLPVLIMSSAKISIAQLSIREDYNSGDQFMTVLPGIDQYLSNYLFTIPHAYYGGTTPYVALIVPLREKDNIILDGLSVLAFNMTRGNIKQLEVPHPFDNYTVLTFETTEGVHHFWHPQTDVTFGVFVYGFGYEIGYGFYPGYDLEGKQEVSKPTTETISATEMTTSSSKREENATCFKCSDITHPGLCVTIQKCSEKEVCYLERYLVSGQSKYRSGCREAGTCEADHINTVQHGGVCYECCQNSFCNIEGCGEVMLDRQQRGPICFHCDHVSIPDECLQVVTCQSAEVCKIEKFTGLVNDFYYKMGCSHKSCGIASRSLYSSHVVKRDTPLCNDCCSDDFCNRNCTIINTGPSIIG